MKYENKDNFEGETKLKKKIRQVRDALNKCKDEDLIEEIAAMLNLGGSSYHYAKIFKLEEYEFEPIGQSLYIKYEDWKKGTGIYVETCLCHPEKDGKLFAVIDNGTEYEIMEIELV